MIIPNGHIRIITKSGGGMQGGKPVAVKTVKSEPIAANITESSRQHVIVAEQTAATKSSYVVFIDPSDAPLVSEKDSVEIYDSRGVFLGSFEIQSAMLLEYVDTIKITV